jgi:aspartyl-tRNA(Asn)/glutamyl-tRNA(Gln) amidotransferase subunit C
MRSGRGAVECFHERNEVVNMTQEITTEVFHHLVGLAALQLEDREADYLRRELNRQLKAVAELEAIELPEGCDITSHGVPYTPDIRQALRPDRTQPSQLADDILALAPETEGRYIVVPDIPHTDLS